MIEKLILLSQSDWDYIQNYKQENKLTTDSDAIRSLIKNDKKNKMNTIIASMKRNGEILKKLADK